MRTFEFSEGTSNKFWNITLSGDSFTVTFGKIGTNGQTQVKSFASHAAAQKEHDKLVSEKLKKGYIETTKAAVPVSPAAPAPAPAPSPSPAPVTAPVKVAPAAPTSASALRTFTFSDASSHKFWNIELQGERFTVTYGRQGTAGTRQEKAFATAEAALKEHDKLVAEKLKKGYIETTPAAKAVPASLKEALEGALVENPDDLASYMAYADYLTEQNDPLGDFIRLQLQLEDSNLKPAVRKKLQAEEQALLEKHQRTWLGDLAEWLLDEKVHPQYAWMKVTAEHTFRRGWLRTLKLDGFGVECQRAIVRSPALRLLHTLQLNKPWYEEPGDYPPGPDVPEDAEESSFYPLLRARNLTNVRILIVGEPLSPEEDAAGYFNCRTNGEVVTALVKLMPKLEELHLYAQQVDGNELFSLRTLPQLRVLVLYHSVSYPLGRLAKNPHLKNLEVLRLHPHAVEDFEEGAYIKLAGIRELVRSAELPALQHLQIRATDAGDKGVKEIVDSGILKRLKVLDLRHGIITDKGADLFLKSADTKSLEKLDLGDNKITEPKIQQLLGAGIKLIHDGQRDPNSDDESGEGYLSCGDIE